MIYQYLPLKIVILQLAMLVFWRLRVLVWIPTPQAPTSWPNVVFDDLPVTDVAHMEKTNQVEPREKKKRPYTPENQTKKWW